MVGVHAQAGGRAGAPVQPFRTFDFSFFLQDAIEDGDETKNLKPSAVIK